MALPLLLLMSPIKSAVSKAIPFLIKHWKEVLIITIILFSVWKYNDMQKTIEYQKVVIMQDKLIIESHEANEKLLIGTIDNQNEAILKLQKLSNEQGVIIDTAESKAKAVRDATANEITEILLNKSNNILTCEQNMEWLVDQETRFKWK